jgi:hypothetical protein
MVVLIDPIKIADINVVAVCAIKKASLSIPAPNSDAIRISLKKPRILLIRANTANIKTDLAALLAFVKIALSLFEIYIIIIK